MSDAPGIDVAQEGQDVTHAAGNAESSESQPVETSSRMEDVLVSRKRGVEEMDPPRDGPRELATIFTSLGVTPVNFRVAELFCRRMSGDAAFNMGFRARTRGALGDRAGTWTTRNR